MRTILHIDMDAFFASVEQRDRPELAGRPVLVGGAVPRGVVAAASYEARPFGCGSAMPMGEALRRCPDAVVVTPRHAHYARESEAIFRILRRYTPLVEKLSVDEAFLDVTASRALFGEGEAIARRIQREIRAERALPASAGVASSKFVAKVASAWDKPEGCVVVAPGSERTFLAPLPVDRMWGVGPKAAAQLRRLGCRTLGQLAHAPPAQLERALGSWGRTVADLARGVDPRAVVPGAPAKSVGAEDTFPGDLRDRGALLRELLSQSDRVAARLTRARLCGRTVTVKVKLADFTLRTRQARVEEPVADTDGIFHVARALLDRFEGLERGVRLTGVTVGDLSAGPPPRTLFPRPEVERRQRLEEVVQHVRDRYGRAGITRGALLEMERGDRAHSLHRPDDVDTDPADT